MLLPLLRRWRTGLSLLICLSLLCQLIRPALQNPATVSAATLPPRTAPSRLAAAASAAAQPDLQMLLNLLVRQALAANGWTVSALASQLTPAPASSAQVQSGTGQWHADVLDEQQQALNLDGALNYQVSAQGQGNLLASASLKLDGTLAGASATLALALDNQVANDGPASKSTSHLSLKLTRDGKTSATTISSSSASQPLAYNLNRVVTHSALERNGRAAESTQTLTTRRLGSAESEVWLQMDAKGELARTTSLTQHWFQRVAGQQVSQYLDRFDWQTTDNKYSLQAPAAITGTLDGEVNYSITLVDQNGKPLNLTPPARPRGLNVPAGRAPGLAMPLVASDRLRVPGPGGFASVLDPGEGAMSRAPLALTPCQLAVVGLFFVAIAALLVAGGFLGFVIIGAIGSNAWFIILAALGISGLGGLSLITGLLNALNGCNADPYFVAPDARPNADALSPGPAQITRVTGGLVTVPTATVATAGALPAPAAPNVEYRDRAEVFLGGALPKGATAIGSWAWDNERAFRGAPTHTQPQVDGAQRHYFIHAAQPLALTADDDIIQYVYLDPQNPPSEIYVQFYSGDGDGEHRAYWGADRVQTGGAPGTAALFPTGALPDTGAWVRLKIPVEQLGLAGKTVNGILYGAYGGQTWWGATTTASRLTDTAPDRLVVDEPLTAPATQPGAQIAFRLAQALPLTIEIVDASGTRVRTLAQNETRQPVYQVLQWDAKNDSGALVSDQPYRVRMSSGGNVVAEAPLTISPFVANVVSPGTFSLVRGIDVPIFGEAYGTKFQHYVVEYGAGLNPSEWKTLIDSSAPALLPSAPTLVHIRAGNLANWNVGLDEFTPWKDAGLAGVYTLRLHALGTDGREASDTFPVIVGRLASFPNGGTITSPDGKARLVVPPLATQNGFDLLALVPVSQVTSDDSWRQTLPSDKKLASPLYEVFPADEPFRQDVTLELPYDAGSATDKLGILLGDGTPNGWRYVGGSVDTQKQTIRVSLRAFGETRALVGAFVADSFGPVDPSATPAPPLAFDTQRAAPTIASSSAPFAFYSDLQANAGEWAALDVAGTQLTRVQGAEAGLADGGAALKVTRLAGGVRLVRARATPYDAAKYPIVQFDYRIPPGYTPDLFLRSNGTWWQLRMGSNLLLNRDFYTLFAPGLKADDQWHHYQIDVLALLREQLPNATSFQIDSLVFGQVQAVAYRQYVPVDDGDVGSAYYMTNLAAIAPVNFASLNFTLTTPANATAYAFALDQKMDTTPAPNPQSTSNQISVSLPAGASDGAWYLHVRAQNATGHFPILIDRQPPQIGKPFPAPNGAGSPDFIQVPVRDETSGVDPTRLQVQVNAQRYGIGSGVIYNAEHGVLQITPSQLKPALPFTANGQKVELSLSGVADYAGNPVSAPFAWNFTADRASVRGDAFRQLTLNGGEAPALSTDGAQVAFVTNRSGAQKIWVMVGDDYEERANSARQLTAATARESDPAWSPDNKLIAYVSDANGAPQIWVAAPDGSGARALTAGEGTVASPTWSSDSKTIAFVRDGNLWQVNADGSGAHALTNYPERPFKAVRWQPGGSLLAVDFKLYQETIDLYNVASGELHELTTGGQEREPEWLNATTVLYTAPAAANQPDAVWQINLDGSGAVIVTGSGQPGVSDMQTAEARDGNALALVSTRAGARNVFLRANLQIARLDISPANGAPAGTPFQISYALPTDARVTLEIAGVKKLLDQAQQVKGSQITTWDGTDASGKPVSPGEYAIKLSAQVAGGEPLERFATARVLDAASIGTLQLQINQWASTPLRDTGSLAVQVFAHGERVQPVAEATFDASPTFKLPAGEYDVSVSRNELPREFEGVRVEAAKTTTQALDLQLGGLQAALVSAPGQRINGAFYAAVVRGGDALHAPLAEQFTTSPNFVLAAGRYDLLVEYQGVRQTVYGLAVKTGQVTQQEINLGVGTFQLAVLGFGGKPADARSRLIVSVFTRLLQHFDN